MKKIKLRNENPNERNDIMNLCNETFRSNHSKAFRQIYIRDQHIRVKQVFTR